MSLNIQLIISYDGTHYLGWQKTRMGPSIQEELEKALLRILGCSITTEAASRTDRGVHAKGQVVHFKTDQIIDPRRFRGGLNAVLPKDISVQSVHVQKPDFHPTLDAIAKEYHYWICNGPVQIPIHRLYSWHVHEPLDYHAMRNASSDFLGTNDFIAFTNEKTDNSVRNVQRVDIQEHPDHRIQIILQADRFLYKMARNIVGTLVDIGRRKQIKNTVSEMIANKKRSLAGMTAPAHGLFLMKVFYPESIEAYDYTK